METIKIYAPLRENLDGLKHALRAGICVKIFRGRTKNEKLFVIFESFLEFLNSSPSAQVLDLGLLKFKLSA